MCFLIILHLLIVHVVYSKQLATKSKVSMSAAYHSSQTSRPSVVTVKPEPVNSDEDLRLSLYSPIIISSSEDEDPTPKAKPSKAKTVPSSLAKLNSSRALQDNLSPSVNVLPRPTPRPTYRSKGKEAIADTKEPVFGQSPSNQPLSETTVYLEDM